MKSILEYITCPVGKQRESQNLKVGWVFKFVTSDDEYKIVLDTPSKFIVLNRDVIYHTPKDNGIVLVCRHEVIEDYEISQATHFARTWGFL